MTQPLFFSIIKAHLLLFMIISQILPLPSAFFVLGLGVLILSKSWRSALNVVFFFLSLAVTIWLYGTYRMFVSLTTDEVVFWDRFIYAGVVFVPALFYHFSVLFTERKDRRQQILFSYLLALFFLIMSRTPYFVNDVFRYEWGVHTKAQFWHHLFLIYFTIFIAFLFTNLFKFYRRTNSAISRTQAKFVIMAFIFLVFIGTLGYLPAYGIAVYPFAYLSGVFFVVILAYTIIRHRFLSIRVIFKRGSVFLAAFLSTAAISYCFNYLLVWQFPHTPYFQIAALVVGLLVYQPLQRYFSSLANKYFFSDIYDYQEVLKESSRNLTSVIELPAVVNHVLESLNNPFQLEKIGLVLFVNNQPSAHYVKSNGYQSSELSFFSDNKFLQQQLLSTNNVLLLDEIKFILNGSLSTETTKQWRKLRSELMDFPIDVCAPLFKEDQLLGIIFLGQKITNDGYSDEDIKLIDTVTNQAAVAINNALLYEQVSNFNKELQGKIAAATLDLEKANKQLKVANENLQQLDQAKSEFLSIASHQLRTPLSGIKGYLSMLDEGDFGKLPKEAAKIINELYLNSDRMSRMINTFLNISRIEAKRFTIVAKECDLLAIVRSSFEELKLEAQKKQLKYHLDVPRGTIKLKLDEDKVKDAVGNYIDNAIKYTPSGSIEVRVFAVKKEVVIEVADSGIGIKQQDINFLFEKFVRSSEVKKISTGGSGLGLYIARKVIEAHSGRVYVKSAGLGKGSIFGFALPLK